MALVNLSVPQNKTKKHEHERQTDRDRYAGKFVGKRRYTQK